jgi:hypothetical protein
MAGTVFCIMEESMELRIAKTGIPECDIEVGLSPSAMTRAMQRGTTRSRTAAEGA